MLKLKEVLISIKKKKVIIIFKNIHVCIKRFQRAVANKYAQQNHNNAKLFDV